MFMVLSFWKLSAAFTRISSEQENSQISQSLTEYLVQPGNILDLPIHDLLLFLVEHPQVLLVHLDTADVGVRSDENVLELCLLLVDLLNVSLFFISVAPTASGTERLLFLSL